MTTGEALRAPVGTRDVLPPESARWEALIATFAGHVGRAGYALVQSPMFEEIGVFQRVGSGTDVVRKEMYEFRDRGDRHLALRPEGTASIVRAFTQHRPTTLWKVYYAAPSFRYERPQAGRFRQHHQLGIEAIGSGDPELDIEMISLGWGYLTGLGLTRIELRVNTMGSAEDRIRYVDELRAWLESRADEIDPEDREKIAAHPMRVLDSKRERTRAAIVDAPAITDRLATSAAERFEKVCSGLDDLGIPYLVDPRLVRGLDYYTHTTFEFVSTALDAAQSTVLAGGRYDGLVAEMGGPDTPGIGFGSGIERVLLACDAENVFTGHERNVEVFVVDTTGGAEARRITTSLRAAGISADRAFDQRSMRAQMKAADRSGATVAVIVGPTELGEGVVTLRSLRANTHDDRAQRTIERAHLTESIRHALERRPDHDETSEDR